MERLGSLVLIFTFLLASCGPNGFHEPMSSMTTTPETTYSPPEVTLTKYEKTSTVSGATTPIGEFTFVTDGPSSLATLKGLMSVKIQGSGSTLEVPLDLSGKVGLSTSTGLGTADLLPNNPSVLDSLKIEAFAKMMCLREDCSQYFVNIYLRYNKDARFTYYHQIEGKGGKAAEKVPPKEKKSPPVIQPSEMAQPDFAGNEDYAEDDHIDAEELGNYVGEMKEDLKKFDVMTGRDQKPADSEAPVVAVPIPPGPATPQQPQQTSDSAQTTSNPQPSKVLPAKPPIESTQASKPAAPVPPRNVEPAKPPVISPAAPVATSSSAPVNPATPTAPTTPKVEAKPTTPPPSAKPSLPEAKPPTAIWWPRLKPVPPASNPQSLPAQTTRVEPAKASSVPVKPAVVEAPKSEAVAPKPVDKPKPAPEPIAAKPLPAPAPVVPKPETRPLTAKPDVKVEFPADPKPATAPQSSATAATAPAKAKPTTMNPAQAVHLYDDGSLQAASNLLDFQNKNPNVGFKIMRPERASHFATRDMQTMLTYAGQYSLKNVGNYVLSVGDVAFRKGGQCFKHDSHQNGLDADVSYYFDRKALANGFTNVFEVKGALNSWMVDEQWDLFKTLVKTNNVDRIFVHSRLKQMLCRQAEKEGELNTPLARETLRRLRPNDSHANHFHLRLQCSDDQPLCRPMKPPAAQTGC